MGQMTSHERILRMFEHREADRIAIWDRPWGYDTVLRWESEGMPKGMDYAEYFGFERMVQIQPDNSPRFEQKKIEENDEYNTYTTAWGATARSFKKMTSTPEYLDYRVKTPDDWRAAKERMTPTRDRIPWEQLEKNYKRWRAEGYWIQPNIWFGYDITHSYMVGMERMLMALAEKPEWCIEMFDHELTVSLALLDMIWDAGYHFDAVRFPDDMGYKHAQFFSVAMYRELLKPFHKRAIDWCHAKKIKAYMHSCGDIRPFIPELVDIGLDCINPLEVKAGMDPIALKKEYGDKLMFHGGVDALLWNDIDRMEAQVRALVPVMKKNGGFMLGTDHSIPMTAGAADVKRIVRAAIESGTY
ncbi:MAG: uroporphyrinogen decarboxylase family protein [Spirochaetota bacterium]